MLLAVPFIATSEVWADGVEKDGHDEQSRVVEEAREDAIGLRKRLQGVKDRDNKEWSETSGGNALEPLGNGAFGGVFSFGSPSGDGPRKVRRERSRAREAADSLLVIVAED